MTWREFQLMIDGWQIRNSREWEKTRLISWTTLAVNRDPKKSFPTIKEFMPLPTDEKIDEDSESSRMQKVMDEYKERLKNR